MLPTYFLLTQIFDSYNSECEIDSGGTTVETTEMHLSIEAYP